MLSFLYPFLTLLQPGVLWGWLNPYKPMLVVSAIAFAWGMLGRAKRPRQSALSPAPVRWMFAFVLVQAVSVHYSGWLAMFGMIGRWYVYPFFVVLSLLLIRDERDLERYIWGMLLGALFVIAYGIWAKYSGWNSVWHPGETWDMGGRAGAYGMYHNQNDYSFIIIQTLPFFYMYWRTERRFLPRWLLFAAMLTSVLGILLCLSRGGMLALVLEAFLILMLTARRNAKLLLLPLFVVVAIAGISYQWKMRAENQGSLYTYTDAQDTRLDLWHAGVVMFAHNPILGVGSLRFGEYAKTYVNLLPDDIGKNAHNTYLDVLACSGLLGISCFIGMLWATFRKLRRRIADPPSGDRLEAARMAVLISLISILFRALMDAKEYDWSFYMLPALAISVHYLGGLRSKTATASNEAVEGSLSVRTVPARLRSPVRPQVQAARVSRPTGLSGRRPLG